MSGSAPRILSLDDYFIVETEKEEKDPETGRKVTKKVVFLYFFVYSVDVSLLNIVNVFKYPGTVCNFYGLIKFKYYTYVHYLKYLFDIQMTAVVRLHKSLLLLNFITFKSLKLY